MAQRIIVLKRTEQKVKKVYSYLLENWNEQIANDFYERFQKTIYLIASHPQIGHPSLKRGIRRKLVTKHNCVYYRIKNDVVIIINMLDTRQNPKKNPYE